MTQDSPNLFTFDNSYQRLPGQFYQRIPPTQVQSPKLIRFNHALATELGIKTTPGDDELAQVFSGNAIMQGSDPIAMAYAGHQFGHFVPQLGDGRAILLGEVKNIDGIRRDIQLKGSGLTAFSRNADGRAALGPVMREYIVSEAMHALGIKTTRSLAAVATGEMVYRETLIPGAVLTRVAASHIRIGTFEYFSSRGDFASVKQLADYVIERHYPHAKEVAQPYQALLEAVLAAQARLVASWMHVGFIHGVMNTDNMAISGETIDYGPCAFMDYYDPAMVFSSIDRRGRYAYGNQPHIAQWNLARFAETLLPLLADNPDDAVKAAEHIIAAFPAHIESYWLAGMRKKLGLFTAQDDDIELIGALLSLMHEQETDFTLTFRLLTDAAAGAPNALLALFTDPAPIQSWLERWQARLDQERQHDEQRIRLMRGVNPVFIPRNHRIEQAIQAGLEDDFSIMDDLLTCLCRPYEEQPGYAHYALPPLPSERIQKTFCGT